MQAWLLALNCRYCKLRLHADDGSTVQVDWRPDLDDTALLRSALVLAEAPALTVAMTGDPTLRAFCGAAETAAVHRVAEPLVPLARSLQATAREVLDRGLTPTALERWTDTWTSSTREREAAGDTENAEALALTGAVVGDRGVALTGFAPLKSEWLAQYLQALWQLVNQAEEPETDADPGDAASTATAIAKTTAAHHPAHLRLRTRDDALLPTSEGRLWSVYGGYTTRDESGFAGDTLRSVVTQLLTLQPEAAGHLRCLTWGPGAADLLTGEAVRLLGTRTGRGVIGNIEVFCIGSGKDDKPTAETLATVDEALRGERDALQLRYLKDLAQAREILRPAHDSHAVHLALITGLTEGEHRLQFETPEVQPPPSVSGSGETPGATVTGVT